MSDSFYILGQDIENISFHSLRQLQLSFSLIFKAVRIMSHKQVFEINVHLNVQSRAPKKKKCSLYLVSEPITSLCCTETQVVGKG